MKAAKLKIGVRSQEKRGRRKKEGARRSVFTNMRCSLSAAQNADRNYVLAQRRVRVEKRSFGEIILGKFSVINLVKY